MESPYVSQQQHFSHAGFAQGAGGFEEWSSPQDDATTPPLLRAISCGEIFVTPETARTGGSPVYATEAPDTTFYTCRDAGVSFETCARNFDGVKRELDFSVEDDAAADEGLARPVSLEADLECAPCDTQPACDACCDPEAKVEVKATEVEEKQATTCDDDTIALIEGQVQLSLLPSHGPLAVELEGLQGLSDAESAPRYSSAHDFTRRKLGAFTTCDIMTWKGPVGRGGCGNTHMATVRMDGDNMEPMVLKMANGPALQGTMDQEGYIGACLTSSESHPNVVAAVACMMEEGDDGEPHVKMLASKPVCGLDMATYLARARGGSGSGRGFAWGVHPRTILRLLLDIARGLVFVHDQGVVHLDMKPGNVMVCCDPITGEVKEGGACIIDFGLSEDVLNSNDGVAWVAPGTGTFGFLPPEINPAVLPPGHTMAAAPATSACDVFSFGVLMEVAACGCHKLKRVLDQTVVGEVEEGKVEVRVGNMQEGEVGMIDCCTAWEPHNRPTMAMVATALEGVLAMPWTKVEKNVGLRELE